MSSGRRAAGHARAHGRWPPRHRRRPTLAATRLPPPPPPRTDGGSHESWPRCTVLRTSPPFGAPGPCRRANRVRIRRLSWRHHLVVVVIGALDHGGIALG